MTVTALTLPPVDPEWVKEAIAAYIRAYVRRRVASGETKRSIGLSLGFKGGHRINQYVDPEKYGSTGVSAETQARVAELLHGGSLDALRQAAIAFAQEHPEEVALSPDSARQMIPEPTTTFEDFARAAGFDPEDPDVQELLGTQFQGLRSARQGVEFALAELRRRKAAARGKTLGVREVDEDEEGLPGPKGRGRK